MLHLEYKESWALKNWCFELWCWRRLMRICWETRRSNQSILKEINPDYSLEGLMLKLKLQYFGHLRWRTDSLEKTLLLGKIEGRRRRGWQRMRWLDGIINSMGMSLSKFWEIVKDRKACHAAVHGVIKVRHDWATELNWTESQALVETLGSNMCPAWSRYLYMMTEWMKAGQWVKHGESYYILDEKQKWLRALG